MRKLLRADFYRLRKKQGAVAMRRDFVHIFGVYPV